jgi:uncharacterized membrane protein
MLKTRIQIMLHCLVICVLAFTLRHFGWNWDEGRLLHPDERHLAMVTVTLEAPESWAEWFDTQNSGFNPYNQGIHSYVYGLLPIKLVHAFTVARGITDLAEIERVGRLFSALWSTGTVALVYLLGLRLVSTRFAGSAALLLSFCVLNIQQAHFFTVDSAGVFFSTLCVGLGLLAVKEKRPWLLVFSGASVGMAMACRLNLGLLAFWVILAGLSLLATQRKISPLLSLAGGGLLAVLLFRICQPNAFAATGFIPSGLNPRWLKDLEGVRLISHGLLEVPYTLQWVGKIPYLYALQQLVLWGMGLPLGLLAVGGSIWLLWQRRFQPQHWQTLLVIWPLILMGYHGRIYLHTLRYFLPAYPLLILGGLLGLRKLESPDLRRMLTRIVLAGTALYALAFVNMYRQPHPRIAASAWLLDQLPTGGKVTFEYWDDALPLRLPDRESAHAGITFLRIDPYLPESPEKINEILSAIDQADFVVLSSTRAAFTVPKMPFRYPVMSRFYQRLSEGEDRSGLKEVARFQRQPNLFGWQLNTLYAEEALRVYDHPLVRIYAKTPVFSVAALEKVLTEDVAFDNIPDIPFIRANKSNQGWLNPDDWQKRKRDRTWMQRFPPESIGNQAPILVWGLALGLLGPLSFPFCFFLFPNLRDRGWALSRLWGLLALSGLAWWPAAMGWIPFGRSLVIASMLLGGGSALLFTLQPEKLLGWLKAHWRRLLWREALLWTVFGFFLFLRLLQPDLWHPWAGGEKPMDAAYLNAVVQSPYFPPPNPWLSGAFINYYYYGFVLFASLIRLTGISPDLAYNLALPSCALFIAGSTLSLSSLFFPWFRSRRGWQGEIACSLTAVGLVLFAGNLGQLREFLKPGKLPFLRDVYWNASRVIQVPEGVVQPITEFPLFSLLYGDLHAHLMALPVAMLCLGLSWQLFRRFHPLRLFAAAFTLGTLQVMNTWDVPIQSAVFLFCIFAPPPTRDKIRFYWGRLGWAICGLLIARLSYAPFHFYHQPFPAQLRVWAGPHSSFVDLFLAHGLFLIPLVPGWVLLLKSPRLRHAPLRARLLPGLLFLGCVFTIGFVEFFHLSGDAGRMNMVFKFYYQIWWILALLSAVIVAAAWETRRWSYRVLCLMLAALSLLYTVTAIPAKLRDRYWPTDAVGLDGLAYMQSARWTQAEGEIGLASDRLAIDWLRTHAHSFDILMEAQRPYYQWGGRMSWHTGLPAVLGWNWHMRQQRSWPGGDGAIWQREQDIQDFYRSTDPQIARKYGVRFIIAGELERLTYGAEALSRLEKVSDFKTVFQAPGIRIYELRDTR